jgi:hypothetical protein
MKAAKPVAKWAAVQVQDSLKEAYKKGSTRSGSLASLTKGTVRWRSVGKTPGTGASRTPWAVPSPGGSTPLHRTGALASAIWHRPAGRYGFIVAVNPAKKSPEGTSLAKIAAIQEVNRSVSINVTHKMQAYLMILFGRATGKGGGSPKSIVPTGKTIVVFYPGRPVFGGVYEAAKRTLPLKMARRYFAELSKSGFKF